jgi:hypothetical protein
VASANPGRLDGHNPRHGGRIVNARRKLVAAVRAARLRGARASHRRGPVPASIGQPIFARARPESVRLRETHFYDRVIARHHATEAGARPSGQIRIVVPYDGGGFFGRAAYLDVQGQLGATAPPGAEALIGHLVLANDGRTNLASMLDLSGHSGSVPLRVPVTNGDLDYPGWLCADRHSCVVQYDYVPTTPPIAPIGVEMQLLDEESGTPTGESVEELIGQVGQVSSFHHDLMLSVTVELYLPHQLRPLSPAPLVRRVSLDWPTITSLRGLQLEVANQSHPLAYDPTTRRLQWTDVPMEPVTEGLDSDFGTYRSQSMVLFIHHPGELYEQRDLSGQVEVDIQGYLISGLDARLFDATGRSGTPKPELSSHVVTDLRLILDDAFDRRVLTPYQSLHFDEVIPDRMRLADIHAALRDRGFRIEPTREPPGASVDELNYFLWASHPRGPDDMRLWLFVEGKRYSTQRQTQLPGGLTFTSTFESGELKIHMGGVLPGDRRGVTHEMNALQVALRDRFERLRARR